MNTEVRIIVVSGNPIDGMTFTGPFPTSDDALAWAEGTDEHWWITTLASPEGEKP